MRFPAGTSLRRTDLRFEQLEDRTTPTALRVAPAFSLPAVLTAVPERVNVVMAAAAESSVDSAELAAAPFADTVDYLGFGIYRVTLDPGMAADDAISYYSTQPNVVSVAADTLIHSTQLPNDPSYNSLWAMPKISAPAAWDIATGSSTMVVAVIDTGVDYNHPDLAANIWTNPGEVAGNGIDDDGNGYIDDTRGWDFANRDNNPMDGHGHGTHCAGTIGGVGNNSLGVAGVNWNVKIMPLKFMSDSGSGYTSDAVSAINYAVTMGAKISSNSWGGGGGGLLGTAISRARDYGHIVVVAAGNNGTNIDSSPYFPASYSTSYDNVVTVAATESNDTRASFSNYGVNTVTLAAPGVSILSTTPNSGYGYMSGTSMATPHVAGAIALFWSQHPSWAYTDVIAHLKQSVDVVSSLSGLVQTGGRLNVGKYLASAGPTVTGSTFSGSSTGNINTVRLTFDRAIDPASFTAADIAGFTGPGGSAINTSYTIAAVAGSNNKQFDVSFATQSASGSYSMVVGPDIRDGYGYQMNQDGDATNGEAAQDRYTATIALAGSGPTVTASAFSGTTSNNLNKVRFTFDRAIDAATFTASDVVGFTRDGSAVSTSYTIAAVAGSNNTQFDVGFGTQTAPGNYAMVIGPDIRDASGMQMNQDGDSTNGEIPGDRYTANATVVGSGPAVTASAFSGTTSNNLNKVRFTFDRAIDTSTFTASDIVGFTRDGNTISTGYTVSAVGGSNTQFDVTFGTQTAGGNYAMVIGSDIRDASGIAMNQDGDGTNGETPDDRATASGSLSPTGPVVTAAVFTGTPNANFNKVRFTFDRPIDASTFTSADIVSFSLDGFAITTSYTITAVPESNNTQFDVSFANQSRSGVYTMVIGPEIMDTNGLMMNQDGDTTNGETPADRYTATGTLVIPQIKTYTARDASKAINDQQTTQSSITVSESRQITDVNVKITLRHGYDQNLTIVLKSPTGQTITLFDRRGGSGRNLSGTVFDDDASMSISSPSATAPFTGSYRPEQPLSALNGSNSAGKWTLEVYDGDVQNTGVLKSWSITIAGTPGSRSQSLSVLGVPDQFLLPPTPTAVGLLTGLPATQPPADADIHTAAQQEAPPSHSVPLAALRQTSVDRFVPVSEFGVQWQLAPTFDLPGGIA